MVFPLPVAGLAVRKRSSLSKPRSRSCRISPTKRVVETGVEAGQVIPGARNRERALRLDPLIAEPPAEARRDAEAEAKLPPLDAASPARLSEPSHTA